MGNVFNWLWWQITMHPISHRGCIEIVRVNEVLRVLVDLWDVMCGKLQAIAEGAKPGMVHFFPCICDAQSLGCLFYVYLYMYIMDVSKNSGTPKWMVKIMEIPIKMDDLGVPLFFETPIYVYVLYISYGDLFGASASHICWTWLW